MGMQAERDAGYPLTAATALAAWTSTEHRAEGTPLAAVEHLRRIIALVGEPPDRGPVVIFATAVGARHYVLTAETVSVAADSAHTSSLSAREREVARLVAQGLPNKTIAGILDISPWTVASHLRRSFAKLGVTTRAELVRIAIRDGLIPP